MKIRKATEEDIKSLLFIDKNSGYPLPRYHFQEGDFLRFLKNGIIMIIEDKEPMGYATIKKKFRNGSELDAISILKKFHKKGLATIMLKRVVKELRRMGKKKLYSYCWHKNYPSLIFHAKNKFYAIGITKNHYSGRETALLFCKDI